MAVRMEIELTSARPDGTWTWRAAGARQPKGVLDGALLPPPAKVGDVLRVEADVELDGIVVRTVFPPRAPRTEPERLQLLDVAPKTPPVTTELAKPPGRRGAGQERDRDRDRGARPPRRDRPERGNRADRPPRRDRPGGDRPRDASSTESRPRRERPPAPASASAPERPRAKRLQARHEHRKAALAALAPEQVPVAEQVLRGGIPAVRQAVQEQNAKARAAGGPEIPLEPLLAIAEELLPGLRAAEWRDRAEAALAAVDEVALRDLRAVLAGADAAARDEPARELATRLREAVERRSSVERGHWVAEITSALDEGRVVRALRVSSRPPDVGGRLPIDLAGRLSDAAGAALAADVTPDRWAAVLEAVAASPVRNGVEPAGVPDGVEAAAKEHASRVPGAARALGLEVRPRARPVPPPPPRAPVQ